MERFNSEDFYSTELNEHYHEDINLKTRGNELIAEYLNFKYRTNISHALCFSACISMICKLRDDMVDKKDYRHAFIVQSDTDDHSFFIAYIKENNESAIIYNDAINFDHTFVEKISEATGIQVYTNRKTRLNTLYLSHIDALVFARDVTRMIPETNYFYMRNLIPTLNSRHVGFKPSNHKDFRLPNLFLKTTQRPEVILEEQDNIHLDQKIHKTETLAQFRARYSYGDAESSYLHEKGIKYIRIIEIMFYMNQIEGILGKKLSRLLKCKFITEAKNRLTLNGDLHDCAEKFLRLLSQPGTKKIPQSLVSEAFFNKKNHEPTTADILSSCTMS